VDVRSVVGSNPPRNRSSLRQFFAFRLPQHSIDADHGSGSLLSATALLGVSSDAAGRFPGMALQSRLVGNICPDRGPGSSAPLDVVELAHKLPIVLKNMNTATETIHARLATNDLPLSLTSSSSRLQRFLTLTSQTVITTTVNSAATVHNLPRFLLTLQAVRPAVDHRLIVFCLDDEACDHCAAMLHNALRCVRTDFGVDSSSLAPKPEDPSSSLQYFRVTFGRLYMTRLLAQLGVNVLPVDVDAVFLQNPFLPGNGLFEQPEDIAVVSDVKPFRIDVRDKVPINGGFIFFPSSLKSRNRIFAKELLNSVWSRNCDPTSNEQLLLSSELRKMHRKYRGLKEFRPHMLSADKYLNLCSAQCGMATAMRNIKSLADMQSIAEQMRDNPQFQQCSHNGAKKWVYFHVACVNISAVAAKDVSLLKGNLQDVFSKWASEKFHSKET
jgi:hypothetical protein